MSTLRLCRNCGAALAVDAPEGLCPRCLMKEGLRMEEGRSGARPESGQDTASPEAPTTKDVAVGPTTRISLSTGGPRPPVTIRYFGDYELIEEIARGGMGVVYKARQVSLNRVVAVKMILTGRLAGEAEVKRFHTEAEAAANLQHPNIVAIHEVGEYEGHHYFSMDYVDGKNLAGVAGGKPVGPSQAAEYVRAIAKAIHFAHQRGTLHRDLKPQNVLVDREDQVRITDFGLAKRMEADTGLTQSGAVMGSPSYMSPEQAAGRLDQVGPASDVYSMGAILYYLLTGRPPFAAETATATVVRVLQDEPVAPRRLNPAVPADLETICLKCLEKQPARRYATARALAEELERFLNGEPIVARRASPIRRGWNWLQRHPWIITGVGSLALLGLVCTSYGLWERTRFLAWHQAHPREIPVVGFEFWLLTYLPFCLILYGWGRSVRQAFRRHYERQRGEGALIPSEVLWVYGATGVLALLYGLGLILKFIELTAWDQSGMWPFSVPAFLLLWSGAHDLWMAIGCHEYSTFHRVVERKLDETLERERTGRSTFLMRVLKLLIVAASVFWSAALLIGTGFRLFRPSLFGTAPAPIAEVLLMPGAWLVPWLFLFPLPRQGDIRRAVRSKLVISFWVWLTLVVGSFLLVSPGSAMEILSGSFAGFAFALALAMIWVDRKPRLTAVALAPGGDGKRVGFIRSIVEPVGITFLCIAGFLLVFSVRTGREKWALEAYGRESAARGEPLARATPVAPAVPDELNACQTPLIRSVAYSMRVDRTTWLRLKPFKRASSELNHRAGSLPNFQTVLPQAPPGAGVATPSRRAQAQAVLAWLQPLEPDLAELYQASARPAARLDPLDLEVGFVNDRNALFPEGLDMLLGLCALHASAELELGHSERAMADLRVIHQLSVALLGRRTFVSVAMGSRIAAVLAQKVWEGLPRRQWNEAQLAEFTQWFAALDLLRDNENGLRAVMAWLNGAADMQACWLQIFPFTDSFKRQLVCNRLLHDFCRAGYRLGLSAVYPREIDRYARLIEEQRRHYGWPPILIGFQSYWFPDVRLFLRAQVRSSADTRLALVVCALERYRLAQGRYPSSLDELAPQFLSRIPNDVIDHQPLHYRRVPGGTFKLYSVGWDGKDDGGVRVTGESDDASGDWVWPAEAAAK